MCTQITHEKTICWKTCSLVYNFYFYQCSVMATKNTSQKEQSKSNKSFFFFQVFSNANKEMNEDQFIHIFSHLEAVSPQNLKAKNQILNISRVYVPWLKFCTPAVSLFRKLLLIPQRNRGNDAIKVHVYKKRVWLIKICHVHMSSKCHCGVSPSSV